MAEEASERMTVSATPERCFEVVDDIERYPEWMADIKEVTVHERDEQGRPSLVSFRAAAFGRSTSYTLAYDHHEAPRALAWRLTKGDITTKLDGRYDLSRPVTVAPRSITTSKSSSECRSPASSRCGRRAGSWPPRCAT